MAYVKVRPPVKIYHLTGKDNLNSILDDGVIRRFNDTECWFCESLDKMRAYMEQTVMCEGKPYYAVGGQLCRYPSSCRRTMFSSSSRPVTQRITGTAGIRRSLPAAPEDWCKQLKNSLC